MSPEDYYDTVRRLGLQKTNSPTVYRDRDGITYRVPLAANYNSDQRDEIMSELKERLGVG